MTGDIETNRIIAMAKMLLGNSECLEVYRKAAVEIRERLVLQRNEPRGSRVLGVYDAMDCPITHDFMGFLMNMELERRIAGADGMDIALVMHHSDPAPSRNRFYINSKNQRQFLHNLFMEFIRCMPTISSVFVFDNREQFEEFFECNRRRYHVYPQDYDPDFPVERIELYRMTNYFSRQVNDIAAIDPTVRSFRAPADQVALARKWFKQNVYPRIPVLMHVRQWQQKPVRDTDLADWQALADTFLDQDDIIFVTIPDYFQLFDAPPLKGRNIIHFETPALSGSLRMALAQEAGLNIIHNGGLACYSLFNSEVNYLYLNADDVLDPVFGTKRGESYKGSTAYQKFLWEPVARELLIKETHKMVDLLHKNDDITPGFYGDENIPSLKDYGYDPALYRDVTTPVDERVPLAAYELALAMQEGSRGSD